MSRWDQNRLPRIANSTDRLFVLPTALTDCSYCQQHWQTVRNANSTDRLFVLPTALTDGSYCQQRWQTVRNANSTDCSYCQQHWQTVRIANSTDIVRFTNSTDRLFVLPTALKDCSYVTVQTAVNLNLVISDTLSERMQCLTAAKSR
jgi:protein-disulfide isomerase